MKRDDFSKFLITCDSRRLRCVDERLTEEESHMRVAIPGGVYYLIDALKRIVKSTEDDAREKIISAQLPLDAHTDDHHKENQGQGCGYATLVETNPDSVMAVSTVPAQDRYDWIQANNGYITHYCGDHDPKAAIINLHPDTTLDTKTLWNAGNAAFICDAWYARVAAKTLQIDTQKLTDDLISVYKHTVTTLSGIDTFITLE